MVLHGSFFNISHKFWEIQLDRWNDWTSYFDFHLSFTRKTDHAGFRFGFDIIGFSFNLEIYDSRHWNYENNKWENYTT